MIGVFDSGVGGLSMLLALKQYMPHANYLYYADLLNVPYGDKTPEEINQLTLDAAKWMRSQGAKCLVVACNTASTVALGNLRQWAGNDFPVIGLVPAVKPAVQHSRNKFVMVLATAATARGQLLNDVIQDYALPHHVKVNTIVRSELVPMIESQNHLGADMAQVLQDALDKDIQAGADTLVLGCTHYLFLKPILTQLYPQLTLVDSGSGVAKHTADILQKHHISVSEEGKTRYCTTLPRELGAKRIMALLNEHVTVEQVYDHA